MPVNQDVEEADTLGRQSSQQLERKTRQNPSRNRAKAPRTAVRLGIRTAVAVAYSALAELKPNAERVSAGGTLEVDLGWNKTINLALYLYSLAVVCKRSLIDT